MEINFMIDLSEFFERHEKVYVLFETLTEKRWLKTEMDIPYDDFVRWEILGLLLEDSIDIKHGQRRYSYVEYVWAKVVQILRDYGFTSEQILEHRNFVSGPLTDESFEVGMKTGKELIRDEIPSLDLDALPQEAEKAKMWLKGYNVFTVFLVRDIIADGTISMVYHRDDENHMNFTSNLYQQYLGDAAWSIGSKGLFGPTLIIKLSDITSKFIRNDLKDNRAHVDFLSIISKGERKVLARIRRSMDKLKSITIEFGENRSPQMIKVEQEKKVALENRLLEVISKREYSNIMIVTQKGDITYFKKEEKIKVGTEYLGPLVK